MSIKWRNRWLAWKVIDFIFSLIFSLKNGKQRSCKIMWKSCLCCRIWEYHSLEIFLIFWSTLKTFKVPFFRVFWVRSTTPTSAYGFHSIVIWCDLHWFAALLSPAYGGPFFRCTIIQPSQTNGGPQHIPLDVIEPVSSKKSNFVFFFEPHNWCLKNGKLKIYVIPDDNPEL